eukprot:scaffold14091_cov28-Tisochrysis_lutea.AAC.9
MWVGRSPALLLRPGAVVLHRVTGLRLRVARTGRGGLPSQDGGGVRVDGCNGLRLGLLGGKAASGACLALGALPLLPPQLELSQFVLPGTREPGRNLNFASLPLYLRH